MKAKMWMAVAGAVLWCAGGMVWAQEPPPVPPAAPEGPVAIIGPPERIEILGFGDVEPGERKLVTGQPLTAEATTESVQTLADGNRITRTTHVTLYRDSQGRTRRETVFSGIGPLAADGKLHTLIKIHDPVAGKSYILDPERKVARQMPEAKRYFRGGHPLDRSQFRKLRGMGEDVKTESLGTQTIGGIGAEGTRYTRTIPAGQIGNEKPIVVTSERWYSSDLQMMVMTKHSDPRFGDSTYTLSNIQRSEPDAALFTVPSGYTLKTGNARFMLQQGPDAAAPPPQPPQ